MLDVQEGGDRVPGPNDQVQIRDKLVQYEFEYSRRCERRLIRKYCRGSNTDIVAEYKAKKIIKEPAQIILRTLNVI